MSIRQDAKCPGLQTNLPIFVDLAGSGKQDFLRILHVDDDLSILEVSKQILLVENNFEIEDAASVDEAFKKLKSQSFDVIVSDYEMPLKNGLDFLRELREQQNSVPFILFTGKGREDVAAKALNLGADSYIDKHGSPETVYCELAHAINKTVTRKKAEEALRKSEARYRDLANFLPEVVFEADLTGKVTFFSQRSFELTGFTPEDLEKGMNMLEFVVPHERERAKENIRRALSGGCQEGHEYRLYRKNGVAYPALVKTAAIISENKAIGLRGLVIDLTERKKNEEDHRISEERFRQLVLSSPDTIHLLDPVSHKIKFLNRNEFLGYSCSEIEGKTSILPWLHPDDRELVQSYYELVLNGSPDGRRPVEYRLKNKAGSWEWVRSRATILQYGEKGEPEQILVTLTEVTESKKIEESLKESEEKFKKLAEESPNIIFINKRGRVVYANKKSEEITGYSREDFYSPDFDFLSLNPPESLEAVESAHARHMKGEYVPPYEYILLTKDGRRINAIINTALIEFEGDKAILGIVTDITYRKKAELEVLEQKVRAERYLNIVGNIILALDVQGKITLLNKKGYEILGYQKGELDGKDWIDNCVPKGIREDLRKIHEGWIQEKSETPEQYENGIFTKSGEERIISWKNSAIRNENGEIIGTLSSGEDITERKKAEEDLRQERDMLESVARASGAGLAIISKDYHVLWANDFIKRYKGETIGKLCYASLNTLDAPCSDCGVTKIFAGKTTFDSHEYFSTTVDGNPYWVEIVATPIKDEAGNVISVVEISVDITERKKNEEKLRQSIEKNKLMNEKLNVLGRLTRHDVGNKLMVVKSNAYLLKKHIGKSPKLREFLEAIDSAVDMSNKMFEFSRYYERIGVEKLSMTDVAESFDQAFALLPSLGAARIVNDCEGLEVVADSLLVHLFYNLIDNSLKYGEKVTEIHLRYKIDGEMIRLFYEDDGVGIPEANKAKLFVEGFSTGKSTGLGLFLIKNMIEAYGWTICEVGEPGRGAKFVITIPKSSNSVKENYQIIH